MRHRRLRRKLGVRTEHRRALLRNLVRALVEHKRIRTTHKRAKEASAFADSMVTLAKRGGMHARRLLVSRLGCEKTARDLMLEIAPQFKDRQGGYTRVLRLNPRPGDQSDMALLEFSAVFAAPEAEKEEEGKGKAKKKTGKTRKAKEEAAVVEEKPAKKAAKKKETKEAKEEKAATPETSEERPESEKKGGFLGSLRKFLKGD